jgi:hypothetical protein
MHLTALVWHHRPFLAAAGDWEFALPPYTSLAGKHMPQSLIADPVRIEIDRPPCPKCHGPMMFTGMVSKPDGLDVGTYECSLCNCTEKVTVEIQ